MPTALFRFYEELNAYLPKDKKKRDFQVSFEGKTTVLQIIDAFSVPRNEIDLILVNGRSVDFSHVLRDEDRVSVYPVFESLDISCLARLPQRPLRTIKFIADADLGSLTDQLKTQGLDVYHDPALSPDEIIDISEKERRIVLTNREELFHSGRITRGILVGPGTTESQVKRVLRSLDLKKSRPVSSPGPGFPGRRAGGR